MRRLLASRDSKRRQRRRNGGEEDPHAYEDEGEELDPMTYRDSWTQTRPNSAAAGADRETAGGLPPPPHAREEEFGVASGASGAYSSDFDALYEGIADDEPYFEGVGSAGFSEAETDAPAAGRPGGRQQWERVSGRPRPRRRRRRPAAAAAASRRFEAEREGGRRVRGEASFGRERERGTTLYDGELSDDPRMATGRKRGP